MEKGFAENKNVKIYYELEGSGFETLVFIHGNSEDMRYFDAQIRYFKSKYRILSIDSRGHGESTKFNINISLNMIADDIFIVMDTLNIKKAHIIGFSDGANIAMLMALRNLSRIKSLILVGGNIYPSGIKLGYQISAFAGYIFFSMAYKFNKNIRLNRDLFGLMVREPNIKPKQLNSITVKTLVIAGENDLIKEKHTKMIAANIPNSKLCIVPDADHFLSFKKPEVFNKIVDDFLSAAKS